MVTPHEYHKQTAATKKTAAKIKRVQSARAREKAKASQRSGKWVTVRKKFLAKNKKAGCAACGNTVGLQLHHILPYHLHPELELEPTNLIALCMSITSLECHSRIGHGGSFKAFNPNVVDDAAALLADPAALRAVVSRAKTNRVLVG